MKKRAIKDSGELIGLITKALSEQYAKDPSKPGLLIAHLPDGANPPQPRTTSNDPHVVTMGHYHMHTFDHEARIGRMVAVASPKPPAPPKPPVFYVAAQRFLAPMGGQRTNVARATNEDLDEALLEVARAVCPSTTAQQDLEAFLRGRV